jgi:hypothetical protein
MLGINGGDVDVQMVGGTFPTCAGAVGTVDNTVAYNARAVGNCVRVTVRYTFRPAAYWSNRTWSATNQTVVQ